MGKRNLATIGTTELKGELQRRGRRLQTLQKKRERLLQQVAEVESEIQEIGGAVGPRGVGDGLRRRPRNEMPLEDALAKLLKNRTMSVTDATEAVQQAGHKTSAENFRTIVNQTLINSPKFKSVSRGQYTAK